MASKLRERAEALQEAIDARDDAIIEAWKKGAGMKEIGDEISTEFAAGIRTLEIQFDARTKNGGAPSGTELRIQAVPLTYSALRTVEIATGGSTGPQWPALTAAWQSFRCCIGFDPQADKGYKVLAKIVSGTDGIEIANIKMYKA